MSPNRLSLTVEENYAQIRCKYFRKHFPLEFFTQAYVFNLNVLNK